MSYAENVKNGLKMETGNFSSRTIRSRNGVGGWNFVARHADSCKNSICPEIERSVNFHNGIDWKNGGKMMEKWRECKVDCTK